MPEGTADVGRTRLIELVRDPTGSLGIHIGQLGEEGSASGVFIKSLSPSCKAVTKGRLSRGDQILEVSQAISYKCVLDLAREIRETSTE